MRRSTFNRLSFGKASASSSLSSALHCAPLMRSPSRNLMPSLITHNNARANTIRSTLRLMMMGPSKAHLRRGGASAEDSHHTPPEMMTPLGSGGEEGAAEKEHWAPSGSSGEKDTHHHHRLISRVPACSKDWIAIAVRMQPNETVIIRAEEVEGAKDAVAQQNMTSEGNSDADASFPLTRMDCMLRGMMPFIDPTSSSSSPSSATATEVMPDGTSNAQISQYWNMFGGMFTQSMPFIEVEQKQEGNAGKKDAASGEGEAAVSTVISPLYCYTHAVQIDPSNGSAWNNLGAQLAEEGEGSKSITISFSADASEKQQKHDPQQVDTLFCFARAVECKPLHSNAWFNLCLMDSDVTLNLQLPSSLDGPSSTTEKQQNNSNSNPTTAQQATTTAVKVSRDECFVKALTVGIEDSFTLFLTGKGLLELPSSQGGHFKNSDAETAFNVKRAVTNVLEQIVSASSSSTALSNSSKTDRMAALAYDPIAVWFYAAECLTADASRQQQQQNAKKTETEEGGDGKKAQQQQQQQPTITIAGKAHTARDCLVEALEIVAAKYNAHVQANSGTERVVTSVSPFTSLVWESLSKFVKGDDTVTIAGKTFTAEQVFTNQFEC